MVTIAVFVLIGGYLLFNAFSCFSKYKRYAGMNRICEATITELKLFGEGRMGAAVIPKASYTYNNMAYSGTHYLTIPAFDLNIKEGSVLKVLIDPSRPEIFILPSLDIDRYKRNSRNLALSSLVTGIILIVVAVLLYKNR
ncbi:hypothetical protein [Ruminococcus flavefaciens]|uniref:hypothetical protein n=1 Tax=Ruminococcus flavefaciens TaxID=1265 RepID=UPI00036FA6F1|nr:hypothetical protein [Ruminococcus flavefaciens]